jgi:heme ABC exporter ATP-binding subunit CcmA
MAVSVATPMIQIQGLRKAFGLHLVLRGLDLTVAAGEKMAIFGPNGSGKTTLLKILATLMRATSGRVAVAGFDVQQDPTQVRRSIGVVTHQPLLYEELTAYENLRFYSRMYDIPGLEHRIDYLAHFLGFAKWLHERVRTLSNGMQKRVTIARALLHDPPVLLLDEPDTGLDQEALRMLREVIQSTTLQGEARTVLFTTHNLDEGLALGSRLGILTNGRMVYQGERGAVDAPSLHAMYSQLTGAGR